jgi:hypothetical protein
MILGTEGFAVNGLQFLSEIFGHPFFVRKARKLGNCPKSSRGFIAGAICVCPTPNRELPVTVVFIDDIQNKYPANVYGWAAQIRGHPFLALEIPRREGRIAYPSHQGGTRDKWVSRVSSPVRNF